MRIPKMCVLVVAVTVTLCSAQLAIATTYTFTSANGDWNSASNWSPMGIPGSGDRAVIPTNKTCNVSITTQQAATIDVEGVLDINSGGVLTLYNATSPHDSVINGAVLLESGAPAAKVQFTSATHTLTGSGSVQAASANCKVIIGHSITLSNQLSSGGKFVGSMTIDSASSLSPMPGTFDNEGVVLCTGYIDLGPNLLLSDVTGAQWKLQDNTSTGMEFDRMAALSGDFVGGACSTFIFETTVTTCGIWTRNASNIQIDNTGTKFLYRAFAQGSGSCGDPGATTHTDCNCNNACGEQVTADSVCCVN